MPNSEYSDQMDQNQYNGDNNYCQFLPSTFLITLYNSAIGKEHDVYENILALFDAHKSRLAKINPNFDEDELLFQPLVYCLFGSWSMMSISIVDDFQFASRTLRPFNFNQAKNRNEFSWSDGLTFTNHKNDDFKEVNYPLYRQVHIGPTPSLVSSHQRKSTSINDLYKKLCTKEYSHPFICVAKYKIDDLLLIKYGCAIIREAVRELAKSIDQFLKSTEAPATVEIKGKTIKGLNYLILENNSYYEITIVLTSNSVTSFHKVLDLTRQLSHINVDSENHSYFIDTHSILGYKYEIYEDLNKKVSDHYSRDDFDSTHEEIQEIFNNHKIHDDKFEIGVTRMYKHVIPSNGSSALGSIGWYDDIEQTKTLIRKLLFDTAKIRFKFNDSVTKSIRTILDFATIDLIPDGRSKIEEERKKLIENIRIPFERVEKFQIHLKSLLFPKIVKEGLVNAINIFNNGISEEMNLSHYLELRQYLIFMIEMAESEAEVLAQGGEINNFDFIHSAFTRALETFDNAFQNRMQSSFYLKDLNDFNLFYDSGIHLLVSAFQGLFQLLSSRLGYDHSLLYVKGNSEIKIDMWSLRLNYFHIFHPEKLISILLAETAHFDWFANSQVHNPYGSEQPELRYLFQEENEQSYYNLSYIRMTASELGFSDELVSMLSVDTMEHVYCDMLSFKLFYGSMADLYSFWSWGYFLMNSRNFKSVGGKLEIRKDRWEVFYFRIAFVLKLVESCSGREIDQCQITGSLELNVLNSSGAAERIDSLINGLTNLTVFKTYAKEVCHYTDSFGVETDSRITEDMVFQNFSLNRPVYFDQGDKYQYFADVIVLLRSYLKLLYNEVKQSFEENQSDLNCVLSREFASVTTDDAMLKDISWFFDPLGGIFSSNKKYRSRLFTYRNLIHYSLLDLSYKLKQIQLEDLIT